MVPGVSVAESIRYISDQLEITMRRGKGTQYAILRSLPSGLRLTVLETDRKSGYSLVRTPTGKSGWVLTRYLMRTPPARQQIAAMKKRYAVMQAEVLRMRQQLQNLNEQKNQSEKARNKLRTRSQKLGRELADIKRISSNAVQLADENRALKEKLVSTDRELQRLRQENESLNDRSNRDWFLVGAMVVIVSMVFGIMLTRIRWRKKASWGDL
jgi:SH3 domain protein